MPIVKVNRFDFYLMRNEFHNEYHRRVLLLVSKLTPAALAAIDMDSALALYRRAYSNEENVLDIITLSNLSKPISNEDQDRDRTYTGFVAVAKALRYHYDLAVRDAADRIAGVFKHYGNVTKKNYEAETAAIRDLIRELDTKEHTSDLKTMQAMDWRDRLEAENDIFEDLVQQRLKDKAAMPTIRMREARKVTDLCFRNIVVHLEYLQNVGKSSPELIAFVTELNTLTKYYADIMAHQRSKKKEEPETPAETPEEAETPETPEP